MLSKKEPAHLMLSLPIVTRSHALARINLDENLHLINMQNTTNDNYNVVAGSTKPGSIASGNNISGNNAVVGTIVTNENPNKVSGNTTPRSSLPLRSIPGSITVVGTASTSETVAKKIMVEMNGLKEDKCH